MQAYCLPVFMIFTPLSAALLFKPMLALLLAFGDMAGFLSNTAVLAVKESSSSLLLQNFLLENYKDFLFVYCFAMLTDASSNRPDEPPRWKVN